MELSVVNTSKLIGIIKVIKYSVENFKVEITNLRRIFFLIQCEMKLIFSWVPIKARRN